VAPMGEEPGAPRPVVPAPRQVTAQPGVPIRPMGAPTVEP
jgi:hypothetical protein